MVRELDLDTTNLNTEFTRNWFRNRNLIDFREKVLPFAEKLRQEKGSPLSYLEIGVFEGMSLCWMLQRVLTGSGDTATGIDPWLMTSKLDSDYMEGVYQRARKNVLGNFRPKAQLIRGNSAEVLRRMVKRNGYLGVSKGSLSIAMVDGNHNDYAAYDDGILCLELLQPGGLLIFDDVYNDKPKSAHVAEGLSKFLFETGEQVSHAFTGKYLEAYVKF